MIYLDNAATSFPKPPAVWRAMGNCIQHYCGNPGRSGHAFSMKTGVEVFRCRQELAEWIGADGGEEIVFTGNATHALNLALKGILTEGGHVVTTAMEHNSVLRPLKALERQGVSFSLVRCREDGSLDPNHVKRLIREDTKLIVMTHASNVTGTLMPAKEVGGIARKAGIPFLLDASQTLGGIRVNADECGADLIAAPGHKGLLGPQGTGFLYVRKGLELKPLMEGGTGTESKELRQPEWWPEGYESGTMNGPGIIGLREGIRFLKQAGTEEIRHHEMQMTEIIDRGLRNIPGVMVYGSGEAGRKTAVTSFNIEGMGCEEVAERLDREYGIAVRAGFHCAAYAHKTIGTWANGTVRASSGPFTTKKEAVSLLKAVSRLCKTK